MKKIMILSLMLLYCLKIFTLEVAVDELKVNTKINFINYTGPHRFIDTLFSIRGIGQRLADVKVDNQAFNYLMKYSIIRATDDSTSDKYSSDIFSIDKDAQVDHIRNVQNIIGSYLEKKYGYNRTDALTLAVFATYYNAVYRGNIEYLSGKYRPVVMKNITKENAGISTKYYEWPGTTKILIPLTEKANAKNINSLDTTELTNDKVIEELKKKDDLGIEDRKKITDVKEKEVQEGKKEIAEDKKKIEEDKKEVAKNEEVINKNKEDVKKQEEQIQKDKEETKKIEDKNLKAKKEETIKKDEQKVEEKKVETKKEEEKIVQKKEAVKKQEERVKKNEEKVAKKEEEVKKDKADIKKDEKTQEVKNEIKKEPEKFVNQLEQKSRELAKKEDELKAKEEALKNTKQAPNIFQDKFYYLKIKEYMVGGHYNNEMYMLDAASRKILIKSPLTKICGSRYDIFKDGVVVISFESDHNSNHNLTLLDLNTLAPKITGKDNIFWRSFVEVKEDFIYAIVKDGEKYFLAKFNNNIEKVAKSNEEIDDNTFITFYKDFIYINNPKKGILVLNKSDLSFVDKINP